MKITKERLKEIIKEEIEASLKLPIQEQEGEEIMKAISDVPPAAKAIATKVRDEIESLAEPSGLDPMVLSQAVAALLTAQ